MIDITLPDGTIKQVDKNSTAMDLALSISEGLARNVLAAEVNGTVVDASLPITESASLKLLTWRDDEESQRCGILLLT
jgi:threonyl-tRNA synthetase